MNPGGKLRDWRRGGASPAPRCSLKYGLAAFALGLCAWVVVLRSFGGGAPATAAVEDVGIESRIRAVTWNIAAINNNPFEYWITNKNPSYSVMMRSVEDFINEPGIQDVAVSSVFTPQMASELRELMEGNGWRGVDAVMREYNRDFSQRPIITGFLKDRSLGKKRLISMPDRVSNTIRTSQGDFAYRPTAINCYGGRPTGREQWWAAWKRFMFKTPVEKAGSGKPTTVASMLIPISRDKYPALSDKEARISLPLQTLVMAIFDAVTVHMLDIVAPGSWQDLRADICSKLNRQKVPRTLEILRETYSDADVIFLQEVSSSFVDLARADAGLSERYDVLTPKLLNRRRDQNSVILVHKYAFRANTAQELTSHVESQFQGQKVPVSPGDVFAIRIEDLLGREYVLASFHGDTNGLATIRVVDAVHAVCQALAPGVRLLFGLDANTYRRGSRKKQDVREFITRYKLNGMRSCWGPEPDPNNVTTFNARTYLQPQLSKASRASEREARGDINPKDFILYYDRDFREQTTRKDNTGRKKYVENMVFPTMQFPSDHGVLSTELRIREPYAGAKEGSQV